MTTPRLLPHHLENLRHSGLSDETIARAGFYSVQRSAPVLGWEAGPGLAIPYPGTDNGRGEPYCRIRLDKPGPDGKRYRSPSKSINHLYIPSSIEDGLKNPKVTLYVVEGEKKALKAAQEGLCCIAIPGVWSWKTRIDDKSQPLPDLDKIPLRGRTVYIVFDSDITKKDPVRWAEFRLCQELRNRGARVFGIRLPSGPNGEKVGLDDYLCTHSVEAFCALEPVEIRHPAKEIPLPRICSLEAFLREEFPSPPDLVGEGIITSGGLGSLVGKAKMGKTWFSMQLGLTVAGMAPHFLLPDLSIGRYGSVLYLNAEVAEHIFQRRLKWVVEEAKRRGLNTEKALAQFYPISLRGELRLDRKAGEETILKLCDQVTPVLVIIDPIGPLHNWSENDQEDMGKLLNIFLRLAQKTGSAFLFVHHIGKSTEGREDIHFGRGSSVFGDRVDTALTLTPSGEQGEGTRLRLGFTLRNSPPRDPIILWRGKGEFLYSAVGQVDDAIAWLEGLLNEGQITRKEAWQRYREAGRVGERAFKGAIEALEKAGRLKRERRRFPGETWLVPGEEFSS